MNGLQAEGHLVEFPANDAAGKQVGRLFLFFYSGLYGI
ncbi:hypothetical protein CAter10_1077 [Collimonas arenae]|nr:hypothetical protein CAter10_1077 [Collimonas arenae]